MRRLCGWTIKTANAGKATAMLAMVLSSPIRAETMVGALARAYANNPEIGQQRAALRALDENAPKARAGWLPTIGATAYAGRSYMYQRDPPPRQTTPDPGADPADDESLKPPRGQKFRGFPRGYGLTVNQPLFDGFKTWNGVRQAESQILGGREDLRGVEQDVLMTTATAYMDVLRDTAILALRGNNVRVLEEQLKQTRLRGAVGQATEADVAQTGAALAQGRSDLSAARGALQAGMATYRRLVGVEPRALQAASSAETLLPKNVESAVEIGLREHPAIASSLHGADAAALGIMVAESSLYPTASITGSVNRDLDLENMTGRKSFAATVFAQVNVPIYSGGADYASIRQAKEQAGQARLMADLQRNQVRAAVLSAWAQMQAAKAQIGATRATVVAAEVALKGIRGEAIVGQRTTFDILAAQQTLLNARVAHVTAQRDRVVASYAVLAAIGRLTASELRLTSQVYDPTRHFDLVKGRLFGTDIP